MAAAAAAQSCLVQRVSQVKDLPPSGPQCQLEKPRASVKTDFKRTLSPSIAFLKAVSFVVVSRVSERPATYHAV